jgi:hypothetical protein
MTNIDGQDYWRVTGLTGTGALGQSIIATPSGLVITPNFDTQGNIQQVDITYTSTLGFVAGDKIQFHFESAVGFDLGTCGYSLPGSPTTDANGDSTDDGTDGIIESVPGSYDIYEYTFTDSIPADDLSFCVEVQSPNTGGSYSVVLTDDNGTYGAALYHVNPEGNDVNVIANIAPTLSFNIRTIDDSAETNICNFGTVSTATDIPNTNGTVDSGECGYSLAVGTNSSTGFVMQIDSNGALTNGVSNINNVAEDGGWSAGVEAYGLAEVISGQTGRDNVSGLYDQTLTEEGTYATDASVIPTTPEDFVTYTDGVQYEAGNLDNDVTKVIHGLVVGAGTPAGAYSQVVTYTVTASF